MSQAVFAVSSGMLPGGCFCLSHISSVVVKCHEQLITVIKLRFICLSFLGILLDLKLIISFLYYFSFVFL